MRPGPFLTIWFSQTTGSTLLCHALESADRAGRPGEWLLSAFVAALYAGHGTRTPTKLRARNRGCRFCAERCPEAEARESTSHTFQCHPWWVPPTGRSRWHAPRHLGERLSEFTAHIHDTPQQGQACGVVVEGDPVPGMARVPWYAAAGCRHCGLLPQSPRSRDFDPHS